MKSLENRLDRGLGFKINKLLTLIRQEMNKELGYVFSESKPKKILFYHVPKCGGTTLNQYLESGFPYRKTFSTGRNFQAKAVEKFKKMSQRNRYGYDLIKGHLAHQLIDYVHPECLKVTILREPVDRIISHYYFAKGNPQHYLFSKIHDSDLSLEAYATANLSDELRNWCTTHYSGMSLEDVERNSEKAIDRAVEVILQRYDIVGFLDEFTAFVETLCIQANFKHFYHPKKVNVSKDRPGFDRIDQLVIAKIEKVNFVDMKFYQKIRDVIGKI